MLKSTAIHLRCKTTAAEITPWIQITLSCTSRCWHRYLRLTDHCCSKICVPIYRHKHGHLKRDSVKATNTCFCLLTSSAFIKSMIHIELKKSRSSQNGMTVGVCELSGGCCQHHSPAFPITVWLKAAHQLLWQKTRHKRLSDCRGMNSDLV